LRGGSNQGIYGMLCPCVLATGFLAAACKIVDPALAAVGAVGFLFILSLAAPSNNLQKKAQILGAVSIPRAGRFCEFGLSEAKQNRFERRRPFPSREG
jgi:hypothetical protein